jgi:hypothetical protein
VNHSVSHYYNPEGPQIELTLRNGWTARDVTIDLGPTGSAPKHTDKWAKKARRSNGETRWRRVGYASHFLTDAGNPLHTGLETQQFHNRWVHTAFEGYIQHNWSDSRKGGQKYDYTLKKFFEGHKDDSVHWIPVSNPKQTTKDLAEFSHTYLWQIYNTISTHASGNDKYGWDATDVKKAVVNVIHKTGLYLRGLIKYICG